jgi:F-type H+-transporting ATPase subunit delta
MNANIQAQKLASLLLDYLRTTNQGSLPPDLIKNLRTAASQEDESNTVVVTSAIALDASDKKMISTFVKKTLNEDRKIEYKIDTSLLAGFTLRMGDELIDTSLKTKLSMLKDHLSFS